MVLSWRGIFLKNQDMSGCMLLCMAFSSLRAQIQLVHLRVGTTSSLSLHRHMGLVRPLIDDDWYVGDGYEDGNNGEEIV